MDLLPAEIFYSYIFEYLLEDSINLALVNKQIYDYYVLKRDRNKFVKERFERVNSKRKECMEQNRPGVVFDRMYMLYPYHNDRNLMLFVTTFRCIGVYDSVILHFTMDKWQTVSKKLMYIYSHSSESNGMVETKWYLPIDSWNEVDLDNVWFAIEHFGLGHETLFDNNQGWNYTSSPTYNYIPSLCSMDKQCILQDQLLWYLPNRVHYLSLNTWLYYELYERRSICF